MDLSKKLSARILAKNEEKTIEFLIEASSLTVSTVNTQGKSRSRVDLMVMCLLPPYDTLGRCDGKSVINGTTQHPILPRAREVNFRMNVFYLDFRWISNI